MNSKHKGIIDLFTKFGKKEFDIWFSNEHKGWHTNGYLRYDIFYNNDGEFDGERKIWHSNGQIKEHSFWKKNKRNGEYKEWFRDGELWEHSFYKKGKKVRDIK